MKKIDKKNAPTGQVILAQGNALGLEMKIKCNALKGQVNFTRCDGFGHCFNLPFQGVASCCIFSQGVALGYDNLPRWGVG